MNSRRLAYGMPRYMGALPPNEEQYLRVGCGSEFTSIEPAPRIA
jgi:hypothetical protein